MAFMETELKNIEKVNVLALTTYALALAGSSLSSKANAELLEKQVYNRSKYFLRNAATSSVLIMQKAIVIFQLFLVISSAFL